MESSNLLVENKFQKRSFGYSASHQAKSTKLTFKALVTNVISKDTFGISYPATSNSHDL